MRTLEFTAAISAVLLAAGILVGKFLSKRAPGDEDEQDNKSSTEA